MFKKKIYGQENLLAEVFLQSSLLDLQAHPFGYKLNS